MAHACGVWARKRDIGAARLSWQRARQVADRLPADEPKAMAMRIAPRSAVCGTAWLVGGSVSDTGFDELQELCRKAADDRSLAIGMLGLLMARTLHNEFREASRLATDYIALLESIGDPTLLIGQAAILAKIEAGEMRDALRLSERVIELAAGDPTRGSLVVGSPLALAMAMRGVIKCCLGMAGWREEANEAVAMAREADAITYVIATTYKYVPAQFGAITLDNKSLEATAEALRIAEESGDKLHRRLRALHPGPSAYPSRRRRQRAGVCATRRCPRAEHSTTTDHDNAAGDRHLLRAA
jgi:adenylate cyclase